MRLSTCKASKFTLFCHRFLGCICYLFSRGRQQMSGIFAVFTPDCVSFCEVSSHVTNSKGRRLRFLGSHRRIQNLRCRKRPNFEQRGCFHQRAGPWCAGRLPGSASGQCGFMRRDWCRCPGRPCAGWHPAVWRYFRQCGCRCRRLSGWSACF